MVFFVSKFIFVSHRKVKAAENRRKVSVEQYFEKDIDKTTVSFQEIFCNFVLSWPIFASLTCIVLVLFHFN